MHIALLAGEASGDQLGAELIKSLRQVNPCIHFDGVGGPLMQAQGFESLLPMEDFSVMGISEILKSLPRLLHYRKKLTNHYQNVLPDAFIGIDYPEFNLSIENRLKASGIYTAQYVSPSVWAWREERIHHIKNSCDLMLTLFDFEKKFYDKHDMPAVYCGHPLVDIIPEVCDVEGAKGILGLSNDRKYLAVLPGSRKSEVNNMMPVYLRVMKSLVLKLPEIEFLIPAATSNIKAQLETLLRTEPELSCHIFSQQSHAVMQASNAVLLTSGTATLEAMLLTKPMLVSYKVSRITAYLAKKQLRIPHFSLPNLLAGEDIVPEFMQDDIDVKEMANVMYELIIDSDARDIMIGKLKALRYTIKSDAANNAANALYQDILYHAMMVD